MDEIVKLALAKWPNVPDCHGWLGLDARGQWRIGLEGTQRQTITHTAIVDFINRNYIADEQGRWLFQNGPQRVYVTLAYTPYVWRLLPKQKGTGWQLRAHTASSVDQTNPAPTGIWLDSEGRFLIQADGRIGVMHDHDSTLLAEWLCDSNGMKLDETVLNEKIALLMNHSTLQSEKTPQLWIRWMNDDHFILPLVGIASEAVAARFGFNPNPSL